MRDLLKDPTPPRKLTVRLPSKNDGLETDEPFSFEMVPFEGNVDVPGS